MQGLAITQENLTNQQGVVKNEVKVNVLNQPYGGFPWLDLPQYANTNWYNAHNFYGDLKDLDAATLGRRQVVLRDLLRAQQRGAGRRRRLRSRRRPWPGSRSTSAPIPAAQLAAKPDISEPRQEKEKRATKPDALATRPALAVGYHAPKRNTPEYYAMGLLDQILVQGKDSRLYQALVQKSGPHGRGRRRHQLGSATCSTSTGPTLWDVSLFHDTDKTAEQILTVFDAEIEKLRTTPVDQADARPGPGQDPLRALRRHRGFVRLRPRRPARLLRALRRRPREDQPARGGVPQGDARADAEDGAGVPAPHATAPSSSSSRRRKRSRPSRRAGRSRRKPMKTRSPRSRSRGPRCSRASAPPPWPQKQAPPAPGPPKDFQVPAPRALHPRQRHAGVTLVQYGTVPEGHRRAWRSRAGNVDETAEQVWLADLTGDP